MKFRRSLSGHQKRGGLKNSHLLQHIQVSKAPTILRPQVLCPNTPPRSHVHWHRPNEYLIVSLNAFGHKSDDSPSNEKAGTSKAQVIGLNLPVPQDSGGKELRSRDEDLSGNKLDTDRISESQLDCSFLKLPPKRLARRLRVNTRRTIVRPKSMQTSVKLVRRSSRGLTRRPRALDNSGRIFDFQAILEMTKGQLGV